MEQSSGLKLEVEGMSTNTNNTRDGSSTNMKKRKQEFQTLQALESKRRKFSTVAQAKSDSNCGGISAERTRLQYVFEQVDSSTLLERMKAAISEGGQDIVDSLSTIFDKSIFPMPTNVTCARCDVSYDPNYNTATSCKLPHKEIDRIHKFRNGSTWMCYDCNRKWDSSDCCDYFDCDIGYCFTGPHTAIEYEIHKDYAHEDDLDEVKRQKYW